MSEVKYESVQFQLHSKFNDLEDYTKKELQSLKTKLIKNEQEDRKLKIKLSNFVKTVSDKFYQLSIQFHYFVKYNTLEPVFEVADKNHIVCHCLNKDSNDVLNFIINIKHAKRMIHKIEYVDLPNEIIVMYKYKDKVIDKFYKGENTND